jgi:ferritin
LKRTIINALLEAYTKLEKIVEKLNDLADDAVLSEDYEGANLLQSRADILFEQMINLDVVISEHEE